MVSLLVYNGNIFAQDTQPKALQTKDLPASAQVIASEYIQDVKTVSHPLHKSDAPGSRFTTSTGEKRSLYNYLSVYEFGALIPDESVYIGNWLYTYPDQSQARHAAALLIQEMLAEHAELVGEAASIAKKIDGQVLRATGEVGDTIYWFVGVDNDTVYLVFANGLEADNVTRVFTDALQLSSPAQ
jgi:hypothetical protein